jgi:hypothetical protein
MRNFWIDRNRLATMMIAPELWHDAACRTFLIEKLPAEIVNVQPAVLMIPTILTIQADDFPVIPHGERPPLVEALFSGDGEFVEWRIVA